MVKGTAQKPLDLQQTWSKKEAKGHLTLPFVSIITLIHDVSRAKYKFVLFPKALLPRHTQSPNWGAPPVLAADALKLR